MEESVRSVVYAGQRFEWVFATPFVSPTLPLRQSLMSHPQDQPHNQSVSWQYHLFFLLSLSSFIGRHCYNFYQLESSTFSDFPGNESSEEAPQVGEGLISAVPQKDATTFVISGKSLGLSANETIAH